jgi:hypothetical protein
MAKRSIVLTLSVGSILAFGLLAAADAQTTSKDAETRADTATTSVKPPETAEEHLALADTYRKKAVSYRQEAATHRQMLETYKRQVTNPPDVKSGRENTWVKKMRLHCEEYIRGAENLAGSADKFVDFHTMRASESQGK